MSKDSNLKSGLGHFVPPPLLVRASSAAPVIGNTVSYSNIVPISQCITTMYNLTTNVNVMSHSSQMRQFYNQRSNNNQAQQQQLQLKQIQQQQQIITTPQTQQPYSGKSVHGRLTNTQKRNTLKNAGTVVVAPSLEIIDLSSPPSSPVPPTVQNNPLLPDNIWELTRIPEQISRLDTSNNAPYKIQEVKFRGKLIWCINAQPFIYSNLLMTLDDLVQMIMPTCTVNNCAFVLNKRLRRTVFSGNSEQLAVLRRNGRLKSMNPNDTPMARLHDIEEVLSHLIKQLDLIGLKENKYDTSKPTVPTAAKHLPEPKNWPPPPAIHVFTMFPTRFLNYNKMLFHQFSLDPAYLTKNIKKRKPPTERQNVIHNKKSKDDDIAAEGTLKLYCSWTDATIQKLNSTVSIYSFVSFCHNDTIPIIEKSVTVSTNGDITFGVLGKKIEAEQLNIIPAKNLEDFANNLKQFEKMYVCHGGPQVNRFSRVTTTTCVANSVGRLQHINCCLVMKEKAMVKGMVVNGKSRQVWIYNLTFLISDSNQDKENCILYTWNESDSGRGPNEVYSNPYDHKNVKGPDFLVMLH
ncbi:uncharacterized protein LOC115033248 [Acyrthosiphon pisum]|uniref:Uncharacterized protein n=1 Tax=Acyrthosiphon pisum TaxID=7029 RepID=A0A8R2NLR1_ACYPI|nr:uncharacterized protein LOC115033248 [Acyrthosiphon pisum]